NRLESSPAGHGSSGTPLGVAMSVESGRCPAVRPNSPPQSRRVGIGRGIGTVFSAHRDSIDIATPNGVSEPVAASQSLNGQASGWTSSDSDCYVQLSNRREDQQTRPKYKYRH